MAERIEAMLLGLGNAGMSAALIYGLATGEFHGFGYAALASVCAFTAVGQAVRLALLGVEP